MALRDLTEIEEVEVSEWIDSLDYVLRYEGQEQAERLLRRLLSRAARFGACFVKARSGLRRCPQAIKQLEINPEKLNPSTA